MRFDSVLGHQVIFCGVHLMVGFQPSKLIARVRFSHPAPIFSRCGEMVSLLVWDQGAQVRFLPPRPQVLDNSKAYKEFTMNDGGKGSKARPFSVSQHDYDNRWDAIFARELQEKALDELVRISERLGLYDGDYKDKDFIEKSANTILEMPGTMGSAKIILKE